MEFPCSIQLLIEILVSPLQLSDHGYRRSQMRIGGDKMRILDIQSYLGIGPIVVVIRGSGLRKKVGENLVLTHWLEPLTISHLLDTNFRIVVVLAHKVSNTYLVKPSQFHPTLFTDSMAEGIAGSFMKGKIYALIIVKLFICSGIVLLGILLGPIRSLMPLRQVHQQMVLPILSTLIEIILMLFFGHRESKSSLDVVLGMSKIFFYDVYYLQI